MKIKTITLMATLLLTAVLSGYAAETDRTADDTIEQEESLGTWDVQIGWVHQWGRGLSVSGPALTFGRDGRRTAPGSMKLTYPDNNAFIPRTFNDGSVAPDLWTSDSGVPAERQGMTWNWRAVNAGQYNYDGGNQPTLSFHLNRGEAAGAVRRGDREKSDDDVPTDGIEIRASRNFYTWTRDGDPENGISESVMLDINLVIGLAWFPRGSSQWYRRGIEQDIYRVSETYTYSDYYGSEAGGSWGALELPYAGEYGTIGGSAAGPFIPATPESASLEKRFMGTRSKRVEIESEIWRLRGVIGTEFVLPLTDRLSFSVDPQFVLEYVDIEAKRTETDAYYSRGNQRIASATTNSKHKNRLYPGILLTAGADYRLSDYWYAGASIGYEWLFEDPTVHIGTEKIKYDLTGGEVSVYIGRRF